MTMQTATLCRFTTASHLEAHVGLVEDGSVRDLTTVGVRRLDDLLERLDLAELLAAARRASLPEWPLDRVRLLTPVESQEVWAAGVTYLRSKQARMEESDFSARAYDHVYEAPRPELFFKALPEKVAGPATAVGIRRDAQWNVPEPELALVLNRDGNVVGYTIGNDMSSRDIEGENLLYLPQAKVYDRSCAIAPWMLLGATESEVRGWTIRIAIHRGGKPVFSGDTPIGNIKRSFNELASYLFRSQKFPNGAMLLTGTGIVPPDEF